MTVIASNHVHTWEHRLATHKVMQLDAPDGATLWVHHFDGLLIAAVDGPTAWAIFNAVADTCHAYHVPGECVLCTTSDGFAEDEQL